MRLPVHSEDARPAGSAGTPPAPSRIGGLAGWLLQRLGSRTRTQPALLLLERITIAPRQTVSLIEADGRRLLIATSQEGNPAFYALEERAKVRSMPTRDRTRRNSW